LPVKTNENATTRAIVNSKTPTGERVEVHETVLNPGRQPHGPHSHSHSEFWLIREGDVEITINGQPHRLGPGSAAFAASNDLHVIRNVGDKPATYFVVALGPMNS
jgi:mannose-6-phosphate isomerase-like protein (cupin superfamily)